MSETATVYQVPGSAEQESGMLRRAVAQVEQAAEFLRSPFFQAVVAEAVQLAQVAASSPWLDRKGAAAYARCSTSEVDRAANAGAFKRYPRAGTPMFRKDEIDRAIEQGRWKKGQK